MPREKEEYREVLRDLQKRTDGKISLTRSDVKRLLNCRYETATKYFDNNQKRITVYALARAMLN